MNNSPVVFIVDDDLAVRESLKWLVESHGRCVQAYASAVEFVDKYQPEIPGCLLLDVRMPEMSGLDLQKELHSRKIDIPIIFISAHGTVPTAVRALKLGAVDFIMKPFNNVALLDKIEQAIEIDKSRREYRKRKSYISSRVALLTPREQEIMSLIVAGCPPKKIASELGISNKTVDVHRSHIMEKLGIKSVAELVKMVISLETHYQ